MTNDPIQSAVEQAVERAYADWAAEHPGLSAVIDRIKLVEHTAASLRTSPQFAQAVEAYHQARCEQALLGRLIDLAGPILRQVIQ